MISADRQSLLALDIDCRIHDLWADAAHVTEWDLDMVAAFVRAAYGMGYVAAMEDSDPSVFFHANGYRVPTRRQP